MTVVRLTVPVGYRDPIRRIDATRRIVRQWRTAPAHRVTEAASFALNLVPRGVCGTTLKHVDFLAGNVPGFDVPVYLAGSRVLAYYPFGPAFGSAVNATLMSYAGTCFVGLDADAAALPDSAFFARSCRRDSARCSRPGPPCGFPHSGRPMQPARPAQS